MGESIKGISLDRIETEYYRSKPVPTDLYQICQMFDIDYVELCFWLREDIKTFKPHIITPQAAKLSNIPIAQYLLDYYLVTGYTHGIIAIIFNYNSNTNVTKAIKKAPAYKQRMLNQPPRKRTARPKMIEYKLEACKAVAPVVEKTNTHLLNRMVYRMVDNRLPLSPTWNMKVEKTVTVHFFEPLYEIFRQYCLARNYDFNQLINMAVIQDKLPREA